MPRHPLDNRSKAKSIKFYKGVICVKILNRLNQKALENIGVSDAFSFDDVDLILKQFSGFGIHFKCSDNDNSLDEVMELIHWSIHYADIQLGLTIKFPSELNE